MRDVWMNGVNPGKVYFIAIITERGNVQIETVKR